MFVKISLGKNILIKINQIMSKYMCSYDNYNNKLFAFFLDYMRS